MRCAVRAHHPSTAYNRWLSHHPPHLQQVSHQLPSSQYLYYNGCIVISSHNCNHIATTLGLPSGILALPIESVVSPLLQSLCWDQGSSVIFLLLPGAGWEYASPLLPCHCHQSWEHLTLGSFSLSSVPQPRSITSFPEITCSLAPWTGKAVIKDMGFGQHH